MTIWATLTIVISVACAACTGSRLFPRCSENVSRITPKATVYTTEKDYSNRTTGYRLLSSSDARVTLSCYAHFPVQWIFDNDLDAGDEVKETTLFNVREYQDLRNRTYKYKSSMVLYYMSRVSKTQIFSCQHASNPCIRRLFTSKPVFGGFFTDIYWEKELNIPEMEMQEEPGNSTTDAGSGSGSRCTALYYYGRHKSNWNFCCKAASDLSAGIPVLYSIADGSALENIHRKSSLQPSVCVTQVENATSICEMDSRVALGTLKGYGIKCGIATVGMKLHHPIIKIRQSISQGVEHPSKIYLNWMDVNSEDMIKFEIPNPFIAFRNISVEVTCLISRSYFAHGGFIALQDSSEGLIDYKDDINWENERDRYDKKYNAYRVRRTLLLTNTTQALYCFAPVWNDTNWVNKSVPVIIKEPETLKITNLGEGETITWNLGEKNRSLCCNVTGMPVTEVQWKFKGKKVRNTSGSTNATVLTLHFPEVDKSIEGTYRCLVANYVESKGVTIQLRVYDQAAGIIIAGSIAAALIVFMSLMACLVILWRKNRKHRQALRLLSPKEISDFKQGCSGDPDNPLAVWKQPYNSENEIDRRRLVINESSVLGKGAFGVVYKGKVNVARAGTPAIHLPVAVKTVPKDVNIMYLKALLSELKIMAAISSERHSSIISLVGACTQDLHKREVLVALEFCSNGNLKDHLSNYRAKLNAEYANINWIQQSAFTETKMKVLQLTSWSCKIADGMNFLASKNIIHGDLAARNILLDEAFNPKIADFGLARILADPVYVKNKSSQCPLPWKWMAIESLESMNFSVKSDVWSYGILLWEIYSLALTPYPGITWSTKFLEDLKKGMRCNQPVFAPADTYQLMQACWRAEPGQRTSFQELHTNLSKIYEAATTAGRKISEVSTETTYIYA